MTPPPAPTPSPPPAAPPKATWREKIFVFLRSGVVGFVATACDLVSLAVMTRVFGWTPQAANVPSLALGLVVIFIGNKFFAFQDKSPNLVKQGGVFLLIEMIGIGLNIVIFHLLVTLTGLADYPEVARIIGTNVTYLGFSYPLWNRFVFRYQPKAEPAPSAAK